MHELRARWVKDVPVDDSLGHTVIQSWWPWRFQLVMTVFVDLTASNRILGTTEPNYYVTAVFPCDITGGRTPKEPRYERRYSNPEAAAAGHKEIVETLAAGRRLHHEPKPGTLHSALLALGGVVVLVAAWRFGGWLIDLLAH